MKFALAKAPNVVLASSFSLRAASCRKIWAALLSKHIQASAHFAHLLWPERPSSSTLSPSPPFCSTSIQKNLRTKTDSVTPLPRPSNVFSLLSKPNPESLSLATSFYDAWPWLSHFSYNSPLAHCPPATLSLLLFLKHTSQVSASGPLHLLCLQPNCFFPWLSLWLVYSQARILEWVAISFSRGSFRPRDQTQVSYIGRRIFYCRATREAPLLMTCTPTLFMILAKCHCQWNGFPDYPI